MKTFRANEKLPGGKPGLNVNMDLIGDKPPVDWVLNRLDPTPEDEWDRLRDFLGLGKDDIQAMLATVEVLFRRGIELVVGNYEYLLKS
jgi:hypothetical protein